MNHKDITDKILDEKIKQYMPVEKKSKRVKTRNSTQKENKGIKIFFLNSGNSGFHIFLILLGISIIIAVSTCNYASIKFNEADHTISLKNSDNLDKRISGVAKVCNVKPRTVRTVLYQVLKVSKKAEILENQVEVASDFLNKYEILCKQELDIDSPADSKK